MTNVPPPQSFAVRRSGTRHFTEKLRWQIVFVAICSVFLPALTVALVFNEQPFSTDRVRISLVASAAAAMLFVFIMRQMSTLPGRRDAETALPNLLISYGLTVVVFVVFRLDYSRVLLTSGFVFMFLGQLLVLTRTRKGSGTEFWIVPFGSVSRLKNIERIVCRELTEPVVPAVRIDGIVADLRADLPDNWERMIAQAVLAQIPVYHVKQLEESLTGRVDIEHISENTLGSLSPDASAMQLKRLGDLVASLLVLPFLLPLFLVIAIWIKADSAGPIFFKQTRIGQRGIPFEMIKFRTMSHAVAKNGEERSFAITQTADKRVTRIGRYLRKYRVDELPQVINVLKGDMSWIGPRPEACELAEWYEDNLPFYSYRHILKPGITGWAQVMQGHVADLEAVHEKLRYDFYYIKNFSIWLDLSIIAQTIRVVLSGFGSK